MKAGRKPGVMSRMIRYTRLVIESEDPLHIRFLKMVDGMLARLERREGCCGHYGEAGC